MRAGRRLAVAAVVALAATPAHAAPAGIAEDRIDAVTGPMREVLIRPEDFWIDPERSLVAVEPLLEVVDPVRQRAAVEALSFPRTATGPAQARADAVDVVVAGFNDAGFAPELQVVERTGGVQAPNVFTDLPGTQCPDKVLVVGAHWDSAHPTGGGADDNASGVSALFEFAHALRDHPLPVTVRLVAFAFEEVGYVGSRHMADGLAAEGADVVGAVSMDMIGFTSDQPDPLSGLPASDHLVVVSDPDSEALANVYASAALRHVPEIGVFGLVIDPAVLPDINRSDHASFEAVGYDGMIANDVGVIRNPNYHGPTDAPETLDWDFLDASTRALLAGTVVFGSVDQDGDGTADVCDGPLRAPAEPPVPSTAPTAPTTAPAPPSGPPLAAAADPVAGRPAYTG